MTKTVRIEYQPSSSETIEVQDVQPVTYNEPMSDWQKHRMAKGWVRVTGKRVSGSTTSRLMGHSSTKPMPLIDVTHEMPQRDYDRGVNINVCM